MSKIYKRKPQQQQKAFGLQINLKRPRLFARLCNISEESTKQRIVCRTQKKSVSNQNKQFVKWNIVVVVVKEIGQVVGDSVSAGASWWSVKAKNIRRPTSANEVVCEECCCC